MEKNSNFLYQLESYLIRRVSGLNISYITVVIVLFIGVVVSSLVLRPTTLVSLEAGAKLGRVDQIIEEAAKQGDYELSQRLYSQRDVLGYTTNSRLEQLVFPELYLARVVERYESRLEEDPYWYGGHLVLYNLYSRKGDLAKSSYHSEVLRWLDPR